MIAEGKGGRHGFSQSRLAGKDSRPVSVEDAHIGMTGRERQQLVG